MSSGMHEHPARPLLRVLGHPARRTGHPPSPRRRACGPRPRPLHVHAPEGRRDCGSDRAGRWRGPSIWTSRRVGTVGHRGRTCRRPSDVRLQVRQRPEDSIEDGGPGNVDQGEGPAGLRRTAPPPPARNPVEVDRASYRRSPGFTASAIGPRGTIHPFSFRVQKMPSDAASSRWRIVAADHFFPSQGCIRASRAASSA